MTWKKSYEKFSPNSPTLTQTMSSSLTKPTKTHVVQLPENSRAAWSDPSQSEKEKLNRFEKLSRGTSLVTSDVTPLQMMTILKDKSLEGIIHVFLSLKLLFVCLFV